MDGIRDTARETIYVNQQQNRESLLNKNRKIEFTQNAQKGTKEDVIRLANELKKKHVTYEQLSQLKEILLQDENHVTTFLAVDGALEALVKALSGQNAKLQIGAAYCLCNLSLGDKYLKVLKAAGPYLLLHLEGMNTCLVETCVWTLGNLSSHHKKCVQLLKSQGALPVLSRLLNHNDDSVIIASSFALSHFLYTGYDILTPEDFRDVAEPVIALFKAKPASGAYLMSILASNSSCQFKLLQENIHTLALNIFTFYLKEDILRSSWFIRIMGNLIPEETGQAALQLVNHQVPGTNENLFSAIEYIVKSGQIFLINECCWLLGNLMNHSREEVPRLVGECDVITKIANPIRYLLMNKKTFGEKINYELVQE